MGRRSRTAAAAAAASALACAAVALAATPEPGKYRGRTSQDRFVRVKVGDAGRIPRDGFKIHWSAGCQVRQDMEWESATHNTERIRVEDGRFELSGEYTHRVGDYTGHVRVFIKGRFDTSTSAHGKFRPSVRVTRDGDYVDTCKQPLSWRVSG